MNFINDNLLVIQILFDICIDIFAIGVHGIYATLTHAATGQLVRCVRRFVAIATNFWKREKQSFERI